jgi:putative N-acetylmannosamine-6-phosphate epimerase
MGHNSIQTTLAIYTHLSEKATEKEFQKVASIFEENSEINLTAKRVKKSI